MESDTEVYKRQDANSWMYLRFDLITDIEPQFYVAYFFGGQYLSIVKSDKIGALNIYQKGLKEFPESYELHSLMAFHYYFELQQTEQAIRHYKIAAENSDAPATFRHLVAKMAYEVGNYALAYNVIEDLYTKNKEHEFLGTKYREMLYSIKATRDLECLNSGKNECDHVDLEGEKYPFKNGIYSTKRSYKEIKIYK